MINPDRLLQRLHKLRSFGQSGTGVIRRCLSPVDMDSRHWLAEQMIEAGLTAEIDGVANVIGLSRNPGKSVLLGSHSDTQPTGGWLDGALGVIYGIEIAQALNEAKSNGRPAIDVASWADEESHFLGMMGSRSFCGHLQESEIEQARNSEGKTLRSALKDAGLESVAPARLDIKRTAAYLEAHIEQGPWLESTGNRIGVVTSIVGMCDLTLSFFGQQNHAGTTPMHLRQDAFRSLIGFSNRFEPLFEQHRSSGSVWTLGQVDVTPNARSIIPGFVKANLQIRDPDQNIVGKLQQAAIDLAMELTSDDIRIQVEIHDDSARAMPMDESIQRHLRSAAESKLPGQWQSMPSGAAHDAQVLATRLPTGMLFIPRIGGVRHDFSEDSHEADIVLGCEVLAEAVINLQHELSSIR